MRILYLLITDGLAELGSDFTGKYSTDRIASQVTVLKIYQSNGLWKGTEKKINVKTRTLGQQRVAAPVLTSALRCAIREGRQSLRHVPELQVYLVEGSSVITL